MKQILKGQFWIMLTYFLCVKFFFVSVKWLNYYCPFVRLVIPYFINLNMTKPLDNKL